MLFFAFIIRDNVTAVNLVEANACRVYSNLMNG